MANNSPIKIEKNVPLPSRIGDTKYPFNSLEVGDSFFVRNVSPNQIATAAYYQHRTTEKRFTHRTMDGGVRVWRTK